MVKIPIDEATWRELCLDEKIDVVCDAFEVAWQEGKSPQIIDYASLLEKSDRSRLLRELMILARECDDIERQTSRSRETAAVATQSLRDGRVDTDLNSLDTIEGATLPGLDRDLPMNFGDYILLELLGRGSFGLVYRAESIRTGGQFAIKIPHLALVTDPNDYQLFIRESRNVARLKHPGIVRIYNVEYDDRIPFLVSEYVTGKNLKELLACTGKFPPKLAAKFILDLAETVEHSHQNGVIHRDIKPSNILVEDSEGIVELTDTSVRLTPRLIDFGIAKISGSNTLVTQPGMVLGTPAYMSPEQARGRSSSVTPRSDIYSLGSILHELLTGVPPFQGEASQIIAKVQSEEVPELIQHEPCIPKNLAIICNQALRLDPAARYSSAASFADDLRRFLNDEPIHGRPISLSHWLAKSARKHWATLTTLSIAATLVIATLGLAWRWNQKHRNLVANLLLSDPKSHLGPADPSPLDNWLLQAPQSLSNSGPLLEAIIDAGPDRILKIGSALKPYRSNAAEMLQKAVDASEGDLGLQLRIACLYGLIEPQRFERLGVATKLVNWLVDFSCFGNTDGWIQLTSSFRESLIPQLLQRYRSSSTDEHHSVAHKLLHSFLSQEPIERSVDAIMACRVHELILWKPLMKRDLERSLEILGERRKSLHTKLGFDAQGEADSAAVANLLLMEYGLKEEKLAWPFLAIADDPRVRSYFVHQIPHTGFSLRPLVEQLFETTDASIQYAILVAISQCSKQSLGKKAVEKLEDWLPMAYATHPDCGVHGICRWLLNHWGHQQFVLEIDAELLRQGMIKGRNWYVNPLGMHMFIVPQPVECRISQIPVARSAQAPHDPMPTELSNVRIPRAFAIGTDDVTVAQYQRFLENTREISNNTSIETPIVSTGSHPVVNCSWLDAMHFCRWLSLETGISETDAGTLTPLDEDVVEVDYRKLGYRLPTKPEWEYCCRSATVTDRSFGTINTPGYELYATSTFDSEKSVPVGSYLPNAFGLFDCLGNNAEWVSTMYTSAKKFPSIDSIKEVYSLRMAMLACGYRSSGRLPISSDQTVGVPKKTRNATGFRVAHTIALEPTSN